MKLLYGTGNPAKLSVMKSRLEKIGIELIGLNDLRVEGRSIPEVTENGNTLLENAKLKALAYYKAFQMPVFSCDSGLYFDNVPDEVQPGVHVRNVNGKCLSDEEMMEYYAGLVRQYGNLIASYRNAICFVMDENHIYESMDPSMASEKFLLTDKPHGAIRKKGFPLDSMSIDMKTNKYYYDLSADELEQLAVEDGFLQFFEKILNLNIEYGSEKVQFGKNSDIDEWMKLVEEISWNFPGLETKEKIDEHRETVLRFISKGQALCVKDDAKIIGVLLFSRGHNMICCLGVSPQYRRRGIASRLLAKAIDNLDKAKEITVSTYREEDEKGIASRTLYKKLGFVEDELIEEFGYPNQKFILHPYGCCKKNS